MTVPNDPTIINCFFFHIMGPRIRIIKNATFFVSLRGCFERIRTYYSTNNIIWFISFLPTCLFAKSYWVWLVRWFYHLRWSALKLESHPRHFSWQALLWLKLHQQWTNGHSKESIFLEATCFRSPEWFSASSLWCRMDPSFQSEESQFRRYIFKRQKNSLATVFFDSQLELRCRMGQMKDIWSLFGYLLAFRFWSLLFWRSDFSLFFRRAYSFFRTFSVLALCTRNHISSSRCWGVSFAIHSCFILTVGLQ